MFKLLSYSGARPTLSSLNLARNLELKFKAITSDKVLSYQYPISNDGNFLSIMDELKSASPVQVPTGTIRTAFLVGESHVLSSLPELSRHCDVIIINDIDSDVIRYVNFIIETFKKSNSREDYERNFRSEENPLLGIARSNIDAINKISKPLLNLNKSDEEILTTQCSISKTSNGKNYFLDSDVRFNECKKAFERLSICTTTVDVMKPTELVNFLEKNKSRLTLVNLTNVLDYSKDQLKATLLYWGSLDEKHEGVSIISSREKNDMKAELVSGSRNFFIKFINNMNKVDLNIDISKFKVINLIRMAYDLLKKDFNKNSSRPKQKFDIMKSILDEVRDSLSLKEPIYKMGTHNGFKLKQHEENIAEVIMGHPEKELMFLRLSDVCLKRAFLSKLNSKLCCNGTLQTRVEENIGKINFFLNPNNWSLPDNLVVRHGQLFNEDDTVNKIFLRLPSFKIDLISSENTKSGILSACENATLNPNPFQEESDDDKQWLYMYSHSLTQRRE